MESEKKNSELSLVGGKLDQNRAEKYKQETLTSIFNFSSLPFSSLVIVRSTTYSGSCRVESKKINLVGGELVRHKRLDLTSRLNSSSLPFISLQKSKSKKISVTNLGEKNSAYAYLIICKLIEYVHMI